MAPKRQYWAPAVAALLLCGAGHAEPQGGLQERRALVHHLEHTRKLFLDSIADLTDTQWHHKPAPDRWSIAECAEHISTSETFIRERVEQILASSATPEEVAEGNGKDGEVLAFILDRNQRFQAPEPIRPEGRFESRGEVKAAFEAAREQTLDLVRERDDLRRHVAPHPAVGALDAHGWLLFLSGHTQRHTAQIEEVKADPGFPR